MATVYKHDDPGVPVVSYTSSGTSIISFTSLCTILKAVLVTGYGMKPAAGWDLLYESTTFLVLRNGTQSGVLILEAVPTGGLATVWLAANYTGLINDRPTGDGIKSGVAANNSAPQRISTSTSFRAQAFTSWAMVADERSFILNFGGYSNATEYNVGSSAHESSSIPLYVGEDFSGNFISVGGTNSASATTSASNSCATFGHGGFTSLKHPATGLLIGGSAVVAWMGLGRTRAEVSPSRITPSPIPLSSEVSLAKVPWFADGVQGGTLRGVCVVPEFLELLPSHFATALGRPSAVITSNTTAHIPVDLGDSYQYFIGLQDQRSFARLVTDNPEFW